MSVSVLINLRPRTSVLTVNRSNGLHPFPLPLVVPAIRPARHAVAVRAETLLGIRPLEVGPPKLVLVHGPLAVRASSVRVRVPLTVPGARSLRLVLRTGHANNARLLVPLTVPGNAGERRGQLRPAILLALGLIRKVSDLSPRMVRTFASSFGIVNPVMSVNM